MLDTRRKRVIALGCAAGAAAVMVYRSGAIGRAKVWSAKTARLLNAYSDLLETGVDMANTIMGDLRLFLYSRDAEEVPVSLQQLAKLLRSEEATSCCRALVCSTLQGAAEASQALITHHESPDSPKMTELAEKFLELLFSKKGQSLVSVAVGIAAKNSVQTLCDYMDSQNKQRAASGPSSGASSSEDLVAMGSQAVLQVITDQEGQRALSAFIATFMATGIGTYIDKTNDHNYYEDMVASVATPSNRDAVEKISAHVTREAIGAFMSYSHSAGQNTVPFSTSDSEPPSNIHDSEEATDVSRTLSYGKAMPPGSTAAKPGRPKIILPSNPLCSVSKHKTPGANQQALGPPPTQTMVTQILQAVSTADARKLIAEVAGSVTAEAVRATFSSMAQLVGWESSGPNWASRRSGRSSTLQEASGWNTFQTYYVVCLIFIGGIATYMCFAYATILPANETI